MLDINGCDSVTDEGVRFIASSGSLKMIDIGDIIGVTNKGLSYLTGLGGLQGLSLKGSTECKFTAKAIASIMEMKSLVFLDITMSAKVFSQRPVYRLAKHPSLKRISHYKELSIGS